MLKSLTKTYEDKLLEAKRFHKELAQENQFLMDESKIKDDKIEHLTIELEKFQKNVELTDKA